jgi:hypothetical protein
MYAVAFFAVASLVLGLSSEPTVAQAPTTSSTLVKTDAGTVRGVTAGNVVSFKGILYAAPPVGDPRWRVAAAGEALARRTGGRQVWSGMHAAGRCAEIGGLPHA